MLSIYNPIPDSEIDMMTQQNASRVTVGLRLATVNLVTNQLRNLALANFNHLMAYVQPATCSLVYQVPGRLVISNVHYTGCVFSNWLRKFAC